MTLLAQVEAAVAKLSKTSKIPPATCTDSRPHACRMESQIIYVGTHTIWLLRLHNIHPSRDGLMPLGQRVTCTSAGTARSLAGDHQPWTARSKQKGNTTVSL